MEFSGTIQEGLGKGVEQNAPTINIPLTDTSVTGIYAAIITLDGGEPYQGVAYANQARGILEAYLFEFDEDAYGKNAHITLKKKLREHREFTSELDAANTIMNDIKAAGRFFLS